MDTRESRRRRFPGPWERLIPIALAIIAVLVLALLVFVVLVATGIVPGAH